MFEEAPYEKVEDLRGSFREAEVSVDHIKIEKLMRINSLITFTKYICQDLRALPPALSGFIIYIAKKTTSYDISKFQRAAFFHIQKIQEGIIFEEPEQKRFQKDVKEILKGKDSKIFEDAKKTEDDMVKSFLEGYETSSLEKNLIPWYECLHKSIKTAINAAYRKPGREGYMRYLFPLEKKLRCALKILRKLDILIKNEIWELRNEVKYLEETEKIVHENKFAFVR